LKEISFLKFGRSIVMASRCVHLSLVEAKSGEGPMIWRRLLLLITILVEITTPASAAPPDRDLEDFLQTVQACRRLQQDELLAPLNVGVKVRRRVAILWGPIPNAELALRAEQQLRTMIELIDVRNDLIVLPEDLRDVPTPAVQPPLFLPEKNPPLPPDTSRPLLRELGAARPPGVAHADGDLGFAWDVASAKR
jgi:hypothetical protein